MDTLKIQELENLLKELEPGFLPLPLFTQIARLVVLCTVEVAVFSYDATTHKLSTLLVQRSPDDPWWPNQWHAPGALFLATDPKESLEGPLQRVQSEYGFTFKKPPTFLRNYFGGNQRGLVVGLQYYLVVALDESHGTGTFFPVDQLPSNLLAEHKEYLAVASDAILTNGL